MTVAIFPTQRQAELFARQFHCARMFSGVPLLDVKPVGDGTWSVWRDYGPDWEVVSRQTLRGVSFLSVRRRGCDGQREG